MAIIIFMKQGRDVGPGEHFCPLQGKVVGKVGVSLSQKFLSLSESPYQNTREGPQAREPSKCLNGGSYRKRLAKEAF